MASGEEKAHSQGARLEVGRFRDQKWMSTHTGLNKEVVRVGTNKTETRGRW